MVTCVNKSEKPKFISDDDNLIYVEWRTVISNNRRKHDFSSLYGEYWVGMKTGKDGYPEKGRHRSCFIAGDHE